MFKIHTVLRQMVHRQRSTVTSFEVLCKLKRKKTMYLNLTPFSGGGELDPMSSPVCRLSV